MIKLLIVDDSPLMRRLLSGIFTQAGDFDVEIARNGIEALDRLGQFRPDVITMDIHMPGLDGLTCLDRIMLERPTPVVMLSSLTARGAAETLEALALGAVDAVAKPTGALSLGIEAMAQGLIETVRHAAGARLPRTHRLAERIRAQGQARTIAPGRPAHGEGLVLIGCSTGGPPALEAVLSALPADLPWPVVVAQHMPATFTQALAQRLDRLCPMRVVEVGRSEPLTPGTVHIGRGDADLVIARRSTGLVAMATPASADYPWHPSVDRLVLSALDHVAPERLIGVLMTGMGSDGAQGMTRMHEQGGKTVAESEDSAVIWGMPGSLVAAGGAGMVLPLGAIAAQIVAWVAAG